MTICEHDHETIVYSSSRCPLCDAAEDLEEALNDTHEAEEKYYELEDKYQELRNAVQKINPELLI